MKKGVLRSFTKFTGKHLCQSLFFNKVAGLRPAPLLKKILVQVFFCEFCEISKNTFFTEHPWTTASDNTEVRKNDDEWINSEVPQSLTQDLPIISQSKIIWSLTKICKSHSSFIFASDHHSGHQQNHCFKTSNYTRHWY